jgi:PAS domain S-box-containing protein
MNSLGAHAEAFADSRFGPEAVFRLRRAFNESRNPMLIADDQRRWVTGNAAACELFGVAQEDVPWRRIDEFTPPEERARLEQLWRDFLASGAAEGWYELYVPNRGPVPVEFSATANVLPARHLSVFIPPAGGSDRELAGAPAWTPVVVKDADRKQLTNREREVMSLVATGLHSDEMAERLFVSPETIKSHVQNAMGKLGAHTRAHAVAVALVSGQISWEI